MSLVECRYNPNHRMKASKREIHEQKCPDRFKCEKKYKHCPYDHQSLYLKKIMKNIYWNAKADLILQQKKKKRQKKPKY